VRATFLIVDGVSFQQRGAGTCFAEHPACDSSWLQLGIQETFFYKLVSVLEKEMGAAYPELVRGRGASGAGVEAGRGAFRGDVGQRNVSARGAIKETRGKMIDG